MARHGVRNVFLPPTALKLIRRSGATPPGDLRLRSVASGGETLGGELLDWGRATFGLTINEFYGQTECNLVRRQQRRADGRAAGLDGPAGAGPRRRGHRRRRASRSAPGVVGEIAVRRPDPVMFLGYWNQPEATAAKFAGDWLRTGDRGSADEDGYLWYQARDDDVITSGALPHRPRRDRGLPAAPPGGRHGGGRRRPRPDPDGGVKAFVVLVPGSDRRRAR